jgi:hypothetical protein
LSVDRTQRVLAVLLVAQVALLLVFEHPFSRAGAGGGKPLLPKLASVTPQRVEIAGADSSVVTLERRSGGWVLSDPAGYPAMPGKVEKVLQDLEHLTAERPVSSGKSAHAALKVAADRFERRVRIWTGGEGAPAAEIYLGTSPGYNVTHVRVGGSDQVYEAAGISAYDIPAETASWIDRNLVSVPAEEVTALEIRNRTGTLAVERRGGVWRIRTPAAGAGAALDSMKVGDLVRAVCGMSIDHPVGPVAEATQGLDHPEARVRLERATAGPDSAAAPPGAVTVEIGGPVADKPEQRYATRSGSGFAVALPRYAYERVLAAKWSDLIRK